jgi:hypothetical protein
LSDLRPGQECGPGPVAVVAFKVLIVGYVLRSQVTANALPPPLSAPGCASVLPEPSIIVISSSGNVDI